MSFQITAFQTLAQLKPRHKPLNQLCTVSKQVLSCLQSAAPATKSRFANRHVDHKMFTSTFKQCGRRLLRNLHCHEICISRFTSYSPQPCQGVSQQDLPDNIKMPKRASHSRCPRTSENEPHVQRSRLNAPATKSERAEDHHDVQSAAAALATKGDHENACSTTTKAMSRKEPQPSRFCEPAQSKCTSKINVNSCELPPTDASTTDQIPSFNSDHPLASLFHKSGIAQVLELGLLRLWIPGLESVVLPEPPTGSCFTLFYYGRVTPNGLSPTWASGNQFRGQRLAWGAALGGGRVLFPLG